MKKILSLRTKPRLLFLFDTLKKRLTVDKSRPEILKVALNFGVITENADWKKLLYKRDVVSDSIDNQSASCITIELDAESYENYDTLCTRIKGQLNIKKISQYNIVVSVLENYLEILDEVEALDDEDEVEPHICFSDKELYSAIGKLLFTERQELENKTLCSLTKTLLSYQTQKTSEIRKHQ